ncbi:unnamed protein product [Rotaria socialis]|uniref:Uncharacterized protein n=1 Tax=Rotaria socialis TaxID=392032 RepID=A0A818SV81_9BILA|nr:unnamed protein product [Rotaria socialis]CAF4479425.1 unnamed protein product [Rotaria socialis]
MYADHSMHFWPSGHCCNESLLSRDMDSLIEAMAVRELRSKRLYQRYILPSDVFCRTNTYKPIPMPQPIPTRFSSFNIDRSLDMRPILPKPITPVELPRINLTRYQSPLFCQHCCRHDFPSLNSYNREPSFFPLAQHYYRFQIDYERFHQNKSYTTRQLNLKRRWKAYGFILIFYFMLKRNLRVAKKKKTYYHRDYCRIRFLELLTAVHRVYLEPNSPIYKALSYVVNHSSQLLNEEQLFHCAETIINNISDFLPHNGILGTNSDDSVLIYLLNCSLEQYPPTYLWSIERHLLSMSYTKMKAKGLTQLDHFTTKFVLISTFIFRCLIKTLLLKPVKYRLRRGQLNRTQWVNTRLLSTLILCVARHAVLYNETTHLPMPFPFEMKNYLMDDEKLEKVFKNINQLIESTAPKLSSWSCEYADRLQRRISKMKMRK